VLNNKEIFTEFFLFQLVQLKHKILNVWLNLTFILPSVGCSFSVSDVGFSWVSFPFKNPFVSGKSHWLGFKLRISSCSTKFVTKPDIKIFYLILN
jgi:hypothetical protein